MLIFNIRSNIIILIEVNNNIKSSPINDKEM